MALQAVVDITLGKGDNGHFLEHFRYTVIASQLLNDHVGPTNTGSPTPQPASHGPLFSQHCASTTGALLVAFISFLFASIISVAKNHFKEKWVSSTGSVALVSVISALFVFAISGYIRRQSLQNLRRQAIDAVTSLTQTLRALETFTNSSINLVQEVELVSRGYRMFVPRCSPVETGQSLILLQKPTIAARLTAGL